MDKGAWQIAVLFAGAALGGTYLGGYEWLRFFAYFGSWGTIGIVLASLGLGWCSYSVLAICHRVGIRSLHDLYLHWFGESIAPSLSVLTHLFLLAYTGVITGQHAVQLADGSLVWLFLLFPVVVAVVFLVRGWERIVSGTAFSLAAGLLFFGLLFIEQQHVPIPHLGYQMNVNWIIHAVFYIGLHFLLCLVMTMPFARHAAGEHSIRIGVFAGTLFFFLVAMLGQAILLAYWHDIHASPLPVKQVLMQLLPFGDWVLALLSLIQGGIVFAALLYALATPVAERHDIQLSPLIFVMMTTSIFFSLLSLALPWSVSLVASGATYCGLLLFIRMIWKRQA